MASDKLGSRTVVCAGLTIPLTPYLTASMAPIVTLCAIALVATGAGAGLYEAAANSMASDLFPDRRGFSLNLLHLF
ncbi:TPA: hypothetical protein EYP44_01385 [Candidatus Bathyarchaeota archaeon]|nr:hypothetical protein [Candidatus Bathyarchaeota archaeon]